jgi:hypothetical protein
VCCDAFFHNLTVEAQIQCLTQVARHLTPNGGFFFNLPNPTCEFILKSSASGGRDFEERGKYTLEDGSSSLIVEQAHAGIESNQVITTILRMTRCNADGEALEVRESEWQTRYLFRYEAIHLLYRCGFKVESLVGDYRRGPVAKGSQLIFDARLRS